MAKNHECTVCGKRFKTPIGRDMHEDDVHGKGQLGRTMPDPDSKRSRRKPRYRRPVRIGKRLPCPVHHCELEKRSGKFGIFYGCPHYPGCDVIGDWSNHDGLFRVSDKATRAARIDAHDHFDPIWKCGAVSRSDLYAWLALQLGLTKEKCHIKHFDIPTAQRVIELCKQYVHDNNLADALLEFEV